MSRHGGATKRLWIFGIGLLAIVSHPIALRAQEQDDTLQVAAEDSLPAETVPQELVQAREAVARLVVIGDTIQIMIASGQGASSEERELIRMQALRYIDELARRRREMVDLIPQLDSTSAAADSVKQTFSSFLRLINGLYSRSVDEFASRLGRLREQRAQTPVEEIGELQVDIREAQGRLDTVLVGQLETLVAAEAVGLDVTDDWTDLERFLITRVERQVGRMRIADLERDRLRTQLRDAERAGSAESEIASIRTRLQIAEQRMQGTVASALMLADLLDRRGVETSQYRRVVIETTGEVTVDILDPRVLGGLLGVVAAKMRDWVGLHGPTVLVRLFIIVGLILIMRGAFRIGWRAIQNSGRVKLPRLMSDMIARMLGPVATVLGLLVALSFLGVNLGTLVAGLGVAGIIVGLALQDSLSNLAAGVFILIYRPYDVEDTVSAGGIVGEVRAMGLANTTIVTFDNRVLFVPNRKIWSEVIENRSAERTRRVETTVRISYHADLDGALNLLKDIAKTQETILEDPAPSAFVSELADSWIEVRVYCWVATDDWWPMTTELPRLIRLRFQAEGIEVPYPRHIEERITADAENS